MSRLLVQKHVNIDQWAQGKVNTRQLFVFDINWCNTTRRGSVDRNCTSNTKETK